MNENLPQYLQMRAAKVKICPECKIPQKFDKMAHTQRFKLGKTFAL